MTDQPRDRYGRPLRGHFEPAFPGIPERALISSPEAWSQALEYLQRDLPFHAHETFEQRWRCCPEQEQGCWQALAQWCAALTQLARGNPAGARANAGKALANLESAAQVPTPIDVMLVRESLTELLR